MCAVCSFARRTRVAVSPSVPGSWISMTIRSNSSVRASVTTGHNPLLIGTTSSSQVSLLARRRLRRRMMPRSDRHAGSFWKGGLLSVAIVTSCREQPRVGRLTIEIPRRLQSGPIRGIRVGCVRAGQSAIVQPHRTRSQLDQTCSGLNTTNAPSASVDSCLRLATKRHRPSASTRFGCR